jgi:hypothetical protein
MEAKSQLNNTLFVQVGADIPRSAGATAGTLVSTGILADGELLVTDAGGVILDTTTVTQVDQIVLVQKATIQGVERLIQTEPIALGDIVSYTGFPFQGTVQQISYIGYNAVTGVGAFEVINSNNYIIDISVREMMGQYAPLYPASFVSYESDATATEAEIANGLYAKLAAQIATYTKRPYYAELVSSAASIAITGAPTSYTFTRGSKVVSYDPTGGDPTNIAVGDYLRTAAPVTGGVAPLYLVSAVDTTANTITLAVPYQTATTTILAAAMSVGVAATINAGDFGIKITGIQQPWVLDSRPYSVNMMDVGIANTVTPTSLQVKPYRGNGNYEQIIESQVTYFRAKGLLHNYTEFPPYLPYFTAVTNQDYATLNLSWRRFNYSITTQPFVGNDLIACALDGNVANTFDTNYTGVPTSFVDVLDAFASQNPALQPQLGNL